MRRVRLRAVNVRWWSVAQFWSPTNREPGVIPGRPRRCNRENAKHSCLEPLSATADEKACFANARESEDLPTLGMWMAARDGCREQVSFWTATSCCFAHDGWCALSRMRLAMRLRWHNHVLARG